MEGEQFDAEKLLVGVEVVQSKSKINFVLLFNCSIILFVQLINGVHCMGACKCFTIMLGT